MRLIALIVLIAVLPTVELTEQVAHVVEHVFHGEVADHTAHHDEAPGDEHGCTGLMHLCGHHAQVTLGSAMIAKLTTVSAHSLITESPCSLVDLTTPEPAHRPPIA